MAQHGIETSTKITDYYYRAAGWQVVRIGSQSNVGGVAGVFCLSANRISSNVDRSIGGRLSY